MLAGEGMVGDSVLHLVMVAVTHQRKKQITTTAKMGDHLH
jgi:hypothetical protein